MNGIPQQGKRETSEPAQNSFFSTREVIGLVDAKICECKVFYGKGLNHVRGWYFWLRRQLGLKKAIHTIKKIGHHEKSIANDIIHKVTRDIVNRGIETDSLIVLGKLKGYLITRRINGFVCLA